jgi:hypothetical protein
MDKAVHARQPSPRAILKAAGAYLFFFIGFWMLALIGVALGTDLYKTVRELIDPEENDPRAYLLPYADRDLAIQLYRDMNASTREYNPLMQPRRHRPHRRNVDGAALPRADGAWPQC